MSTVQVYYKKDYVNKDGTSSIYLHVHHKGKRVAINTEVSVQKKYWDDKNRKVKSSHPQHQDYNLIIDNCKARVNDVFVKARLENKNLTAAGIKAEYLKYTDSGDFYKFFDKVIKQQYGNIATGTLKHHKSVMRKLKEFHPPPLQFQKITHDFLEQYQKYLKTVCGNNLNTIHSNLKNIRVYINIARRRGIIQESAFDTFKLKKGSYNRAYLSDVELRAFFIYYKCRNGHPGFKYAMRAFLFSSQTGLRLSDVKNFTTEQVVNNTIVVKMQKTKNVTGKTIHIPLTRRAKDLIREAEADANSIFIFNQIAEQKINKYLKDVCAAFRIKKKISFHSARHTFATLFLKKTKNLPALQKILGHSNIRETMIYVHVLNEDIENEMKKFEL